MKKLLVYILILLLFCGCAAKSVESCPVEEDPEACWPAEEMTPEETTPVETGAPLAPPDMEEELETEPVIEEVDIIRKEPCELTVVSGTNLIQAMGGTYSWRYDNGDGTQCGVEACGMHPLDAREYTPVLNMDGTAAQLLFGAELPDEVSVRGWSVRHWGDTEAEAEEIPVDGMAFELKNEGYVYEVTATWNRFEKWGGTAHYTFCAVPLGIQLHAEAVTDKGMTLVCTQSGGAPSGELQTGQPYWIEKRNEDGSWSSVYEPQYWEDIAYGIPKEDKVQWDLNWENSIGSLPDGIYRVGKEITDFRGPGDFDTYRMYSDNFSIIWVE